MKAIQKYWWVLLILLLLILISGWLIKRQREQSGLNKTKVLKKGDESNEVKALQILVNGKIRQINSSGTGDFDIDVATIREDGIFGEKTEGALFLTFGVKEISLAQAGIDG